MRLPSMARFRQHVFLVVLNAVVLPMIACFLGFVCKRSRSPWLRKRIGVFLNRMLGEHFSQLVEPPNHDRDLAAPGLDGTQPWSAVADAAAARLQRRIDRGKQAQEALSRRHEQHVASICDSPASTMLFQAWREEAAAAVERGQAAAAAPAPATNNEVWSKRLDHAPSTLFSSLDLSLNERQKASLPPQPKVGGYGAIHAQKNAGTPPKKVYAKRGEGLDTPTTGYARRAALKGRTPPQRTPSSGAPTTASSRRTRQKKPKPASPKERWGAGGRQTAAEREKDNDEDPSRGVQRRIQLLAAEPLGRGAAVGFGLSGALLVVLGVDAGGVPAPVPGKKVEAKERTRSVSHELVLERDRVRHRDARPRPRRRVEHVLDDELGEHLRRVDAVHADAARQAHRRVDS